MELDVEPAPDELLALDESAPVVDEDESVPVLAPPVEAAVVVPAVPLVPVAEEVEEPVGLEQPTAVMSPSRIHPRT
jgi:hypothetical protein